MAKIARASLWCVGVCVAFFALARLRKKFMPGRCAHTVVWWCSEKDITHPPRHMLGVYVCVCAARALGIVAAGASLLYGRIAARARVCY